MRTIVTLDRDKMLTMLVTGLLQAKQGRYINDNGLVTMKHATRETEHVAWTDPDEPIVVIDAAILLESIEKVSDYEKDKYAKDDSGLTYEQQTEE